MSTRLEHKIALVTGAASGIGKAITEAFVTEGATVIGADIADIQDRDGLALVVRLDVTKGDAWEQAIHAVVEKFGRLDILINCAGVALKEDALPIWDVSEDAWNFTNAVNSTGVFLGCKYGARQMIKQSPHTNGDRGWIVNLASIYGQVASPHILPYVASKHACVGITRAAAMDCSTHRVHVNAICPGFVNTPLTKSTFQSEESVRIVEARHPFRGTGVPDDVARAAVYLASPDNTWMQGALLTVDGGYTVQ